MLRQFYQHWHTCCFTWNYRAGLCGKGKRRKGRRTLSGNEKTKEPRPMLGGIKTKSVIAKWYLTNVRGLKVSYRILVPHCVILGMVMYTTAWVIVPA